MSIRNPCGREFKIETVKSVTRRALPRKHVVRDLGLQIAALYHRMVEFEADRARVSLTSTSAGRRTDASAPRERAAAAGIRYPKNIY